MSEADENEKILYLLNKRREVLEEIKPICEAFKIFYDYIVSDDGNEILLLDDTRIGCTCNSISAVKEEVIGYIFVNHYSRWWYHKPQTLKQIKKYWKE